MIRILAICGSLRRASSNRAVLEAAAALAPPGVEVELWSGQRGLPAFEPDAPLGPPAVHAFRARLARADGLLVASPEYAHGVVGSLKNALEWVTASGELMDLPTAILNASTRAHLGYSSLIDTLGTMDVRVVHDACVTVPLTSNVVTPAEILAAPRLSGAVEEAVSALVRAIRAQPRARTAAPAMAPVAAEARVISVSDGLALGPPPAGNLAIPAFTHGSLEAELYAPRGVDPQTPHERDELYVIARGTARFASGGDDPREVAAGDLLVVPAGRPHRFLAMSEDFATWVVFYSP